MNFITITLQKNIYSKLKRYEQGPNKTFFVPFIAVGNTVNNNKNGG